MNIRFFQIAVIFTVLLLIGPLTASAQENTSNLANTSADNADVGVDAQEKLSVLFYLLHDVNSKELVTNTHASVLLVNEKTNDVLRPLSFIDDDGILSLQIPSGHWELTIQVDNIDTLGKDYYYQSSVEVMSDSDIREDLYLLPVGSVRGVVYDQEGNVLRYVDLKFDCSTDHGDTRTIQTDQFGSFQKEWLPTGSCRISSATEDANGLKNVLVKQGQLNTVDIVLEVEQKIPLTVILTTALAVLFVAFVVVIWYVIRRLQVRETSLAQSLAEQKQVLQTALDEKEALAARLAQKNELLSVSQAQVQVSLQKEQESRMNDILATCTDRERLVVTHVLDAYKAGKKQVSQATVRHAVKIPKTSLARLLATLEQKKILFVEKEGNAKNITLTPWFLAKGETERNSSDLDTLERNGGVQ